MTGEEGKGLIRISFYRILTKYQSVNQVEPRLGLTFSVPYCMLSLSADDRMDIDWQMQL